MNDVTKYTGVIKANAELPDQGHERRTNECWATNYRVCVEMKNEGKCQWNTVQ